MPKSPAGRESCGLRPRAGSIPGAHRLVFSKCSTEVGPAHPGVIDGGTRLDLLPSRQRTQDHGIEARVADESCRDIERSLIVARQRNTDAITVAMGLTVERLVVDAVEGLHPTRPRELRRRPGRRAAGVVRRVAGDVAV